MKRNSIFLKGVATLLTAATLYGCAGGGAVPKRKQMPDFDSYNGFEGAVPFSSHTNQAQADYAFTASNIDLPLNGSMQGFAAVSLPDASNDSLVVSLLHSFKPFALPLISSWAREQKRGVMIDLSSHKDSNTHRTDYVLSRTNDFSIPIVVMWDSGSSARVAELRAIVGELPSVNFSCTSGADPSATNYSK